MAALPTTTPAAPATAEEQKAASEQRLQAAERQVSRTERAYKAAEKAAAAKRKANAAEIDRVSAERHAAYVVEFHSHEAARDAIAEARARAKGEAGKLPATYAKMLAAEQPYKDAQAAYEAAKTVSDASKARADALHERYKADYDLSKFGTFEAMRKDHPDLKAAQRQEWKDASTTQRAQYALWRKEATYQGARNRLAGKISDADINAWPSRADARARLAGADAKLGELTGDAAIRAAATARENARAALQNARTAVDHPTWKYPLRAAPTRAASYSGIEAWPKGTLKAARKADAAATKDRHVGDLALSELQHAQGFDGKPDIVSEAEIERYVKAGEVELWRGDTKTAHTDNLLIGEYHAGLGIRGNGTYAQEARAGGQTVARGYAKDHGSNGLMIRMAVKADARVIDHDRLKSLAHQAARDAQSAQQAAKASGNSAARERSRILEWLASSDTSRYAVALGYDAVRIPAHGQWIILNRTALRISNQVFG